ncbi:E3 ubiquitin-protein ligase RNF133-like [Meleagris gallopavo]|uniref:E3 ubiquitin-protein ligase RNF133-like n=1 Tax=Meleagris gallopavo TaxID=9103 RepID=UPI0012ABFF23|nr:E3 ubiquitin-protein ligase RNF133-like [Meleagris gallopavo]
MRRGNKLGATCFLVIAGVLFRTTETTAERAFVSLLYFNSTSNRSASEQCECGLYGLNSPLLSAQGFVAIPKAASLQACDWNTQFTVTELPWIALIERGNCTFAEKIKVAARRGATAAVIYNAPAKRSYPIPMSHIELSCTVCMEQKMPGEGVTTAVQHLEQECAWR